MKNPREEKKKRLQPTESYLMMKKLGTYLSPILMYIERKNNLFIKCKTNIKRVILTDILFSKMFNLVVNVEKIFYFDFKLLNIVIFFSF